MFLMTMMIGQAGPRKLDDSAHLEYLIAQMAKEDVTALEEFYEQTKTSVYGFSLSILKNSFLAEDVMQDTFLKVYHNADAYKPMGKPMAWVLTIVRNLSLMKIRSNKSSDYIPIEDISISDDNDDIQAATDREILYTAFQVLNEEEREIVVLHAVSGLKHREIADVMQIPISTVLSKYRRALTKLKKSIQEEE